MLQLFCLRFRNSEWQPNPANHTSFERDTNLVRLWYEDGMTVVILKVLFWRSGEAVVINNKRAEYHCFLPFSHKFQQIILPSCVIISTWIKRWHIAHMESSSHAFTCFMCIYFYIRAESIRDSFAGPMTACCAVAPTCWNSCHTHNI